MTRLRFHRVASAEAEAAVRWYNERQPGLGNDFRAELETAVGRVMDWPLVWPISQYDPLTRSHPLSRFPYSIVKVVQGDDVTVAAVAHAKRRPGHWRERIG